MADPRDPAPPGTPFDHPLLHLPLTGTAVVEASAGTGKTWTISGLYLRLLVERDIEPNAILVVTFTIAATAELKERIRARLHALRIALERPGQAADPLIAELISRAPDREVLRRRAALAVETFDEAAIYTIHGFCQRVLADHAFESAGPFQSEIAPDEALIDEAAHDFWRRHTHAIDPFQAGYLVQTGKSPAALARDARDLLRGERLNVVAPQASDRQAAQAAFHSSLDAARAEWLAAREAIESMLLKSDGLNRTSYKLEWIAANCAALDTFFADATAGCIVPDGLQRFAASALRDKTKQGKTAPVHRFFDLAEVLSAHATACRRAMDDAWIELVVQFAAHAREVIERHKLELGVQSFDDLLRRVERALVADGDGSLVRAIADRYRAALIDEFQDTDDLQYTILRRLFARSGCALFLVGDPKQAIYAFRGADVYTYLHARDDAEQRVALEVNRRSTPRLVHALNTIFGRVAAPFAAPGIDYPRAESLHDYGERCELPAPRAPLSIWYVEGAFGQGETEDKGPLRRRVAEATARDIAGLLDGARRGLSSLATASARHPLHGSDIAVIVRQHSEAELVREALAAHGLACVTFGQASVFESAEARDLAQVIHAIARPGDERQVRGALSTILFGRSAADIARLAADPLQWESALAWFRTLHDTLRDHGVVRVMRDIIERENVPARLLGYLDGERRLTNFRHLAELLHALAVERGFDPQALARYLTHAAIEPPAVDEAAQVRLESDERLVRVITIHAAKGLEFPIVYCPFLWDSRNEATQPPLRFHARDGQHTPSIDLGSGQFDSHREIANEEGFAEQLRLVYVALTRAKHHCVVVWGAAKQGAHSALAWLLHGPTELSGELRAARDRLEARLKKLTAAALLAEVETLARETSGCIDVQAFPEQTQERDAPHEITRQPGLSARFRGAVPAPRRTASFTALHAGIELDAPDHDGYVRTDAEAMDESGAADPIVEFPRGAKAGSCLHEVFERVMQHTGSIASLPRSTLEEWSGHALSAHGLAERWRAAAADLVLQTVLAPLDRRDGFALAKIESDRRLSELEFHFALAGGGARQWVALDQAVRLHRQERGLPAAAATLSESRATAFMKGFVDLVFERDGRYAIVDYKSNWLGASFDRYGPAMLDEAIAAEHYDLQYLLYTLAVDRWLASRLPGYDYVRHFGGVYYLFVRGMRTSGPAGHGVYFARPSFATITVLRQLMAAAQRA